MRVSVPVRGFAGERLGRLAGSGAGSALRSTLPLAVSGSASIGT
jgi:hypothetical protein